jgi:hypothetical protein
VVTQVKKARRPPKNRRKQPHETESKNGGKQMSRHGVVIECVHCGEPGHNRGGGGAAKAGLSPKQFIPEDTYLVTIWSCGIT